jgi:hypothetical protein
VKDNKLLPGLRFIRATLAYSQWRKDLIEDWFSKQSQATTRVRLKGLAVFGEWCKMKGLSPQEVAKQENPGVWLEECIGWIYKAGGSYVSADTCRTAVSVLFRDWFMAKEVGNSNLVRQTLKIGAEERTPQGSKRKIWDIDILVEGMRREASQVGMECLQWYTLMGRVGASLIMFTCCRVKDMFNIVPGRSKWEGEDGTIMLAMRTKDGGGRLKYKVILEMRDKNIDPIETVREYRKRWLRKRKDDVNFFITEDGSPIPSSEKFSKEILIPYIRHKGIDRPYTPYSIKTAVITALFNKGYTKDQVSAFSGHSSNTNTALKHYHDPTNQWLGFQIPGICNTGMREEETRMGQNVVAIENTGYKEDNVENDSKGPANDGGEKGREM